VKEIFWLDFGRDIIGRAFYSLSAHYIHRCYSGELHGHSKQAWGRLEITSLVLDH